MADLIQELRTEVRNGRLLNLFLKHRPTLIALVVGLLTATGAISWYQGHQQAKRSDAGAEYLEAAALAEGGNDVSAIPRLAKAMEEGTPGWKHLAAIEHAAMLTRQKNYEGAKEAYDAIIADASADIVIRDYAVVMSAWLILEYNLGEPQAAQQRLLAMTGEGKAWRFTATELLAMASLKTGDTAKAREYLKTLSESLIVPATVQQRATELLATLPQDTTIGEKP